MATVKNFGLAGVAANVQYKKGGGKVDWDDTRFSVTDKDGTAVALGVALTPSNDDDAASKQYVDSVATGLDVKDSVRLATIAAFTTGTPVYTAGVSEGQGTWSGFGTSLLVDGVTLANGDRILVKNEVDTDREGHGIWVVSGVGSAVTLARSSDADNSPANEVSGGMFTFVEEGSQADTGWVMNSPNGIAVLDTVSANVLLFGQFSGAGSFTGGDGIDITGGVISHDTSGTTPTAVAITDVITFFDGGVSGSLENTTFSSMVTTLDILTDTGGVNALTADQGITFSGQNLSLTIPGLTDGAATLVLADSLAVFDGASTLEYTFTDVVDDLDIPHGVNLNATGGVYRVATDGGEDDYIIRVPVTTGSGLTNPIVLTNADGISGVPTFDFDIAGLTNETGANIISTDELVIDDGGVTKAITVAELGIALLANADDTRIDAGDGFTFVATADTVDSVTIGVKDQPNVASLAIAEFKHGAVDDACGFVFTNGTNEVRIETQGETNCDIRLVPGGTGAVLIGDTGAALIQGDDDTALTVKGGDAVAGAAGDLILEGGDGSGAFDDGDVLIRPGTGGTAIGTVCIQDEDEENVACFLGTAGTDVNYFEFTSAITATGPTLTTEGESNVDLTITAKGTGRVTLDGNEFPSGASLAGSVFVIGDSDGSAGDISAIQATTGGATKQFLQYDDAGGAFTWEDVTTIGDNAFGVVTGDSGTATADTLADTISISGGGSTHAITTTASEGPGDDLIIEVVIDTAGLTSATDTVLTTDLLLIHDSSTSENMNRTVALFLADLDIVNSLGSNGIAVQTGADTYTAVDIVASVLHPEQGIIVNNGSGGSASDIEIGLDINGLTVEATVDGAADFLVMYDASGAVNRKVLVDSLVDASNQNIWTTIDADTGTDPAPVTDGDTLILAGGLGIATVGSGADTVTFNMDIDTNLTPVAEDMTATDEFAFFNSSGAVGNVGSLSGQRVADGVATILSLDNTRITDAANVTVDTDATAGTVTINVDDTGAGSHQIATFGPVVADTTVTDARFEFTARDLVDTTGNDEIIITADGGATDIDIRLAPKGAGEVILGDAANATLTASDGTTGFNLTLSSGDGSAGDGGAIILTPGTGTGTDGEVCITDAAGVNVTCFDGVSSAVNSLQITNSATGGGPLFTAEGSDTNIDLEFLPKGTGVLSIDASIASATYRDNLADNSNDIPNTAYVAEQAAAVLSGAVSTVEFIVNLGVDTITDSDAIPAGATVLRVSIDVTTLNTTSTLTIGTTGSPTAYADATTNDPSSADLYNVDLRSATIGTVRATVASQTGAVGSATVVVEYRNA